MRVNVTLSTCNFSKHTQHVKFLAYVAVMCGVFEAGDVGGAVSMDVVVVPKTLEEGCFLDWSDPFCSRVPVVCRGSVRGCVSIGVCIFESIVGQRQLGGGVGFGTLLSKIVGAERSGWVLSK